MEQTSLLGPIGDCIYLSVCLRFLSLRHVPHYKSVRLPSACRRPACAGGKKQRSNKLCRALPGPGVFLEAAASPRSYRVQAHKQTCVCPHVEEVHARKGYPKDELQLKVEEVAMGQE
jgi:hypothetical protein